LLIWLFVVDRLRYAFIAAMLVLTLRPTVFLLERVVPLHPCGGAVTAVITASGIET
jgi:hypothetical protein